MKPTGLPLLQIMQHMVRMVRGNQQRPATELRTLRDAVKAKGQPHIPHVIHRGANTTHAGPPKHVELEVLRLHQHRSLWLNLTALISA